MILINSSEKNGNNNSNNNSATLNPKLLNIPPQKRYAHSACLVNNKMYVFGGLATH